MYEQRSRSADMQAHTYKQQQVMQTIAASQDDYQCSRNCIRILAQRMQKLGQNVDFFTQTSGDILTKSLKDMLYMSCERIRGAKHDNGNFTRIDVERLFPLDFTYNAKYRVCFYEYNKKFLTQLQMPNLQSFLDPYVRQSRQEMQQRTEALTADLIQIMRYFDEVYNDE